VAHGDNLGICPMHSYNLKFAQLAFGASLAIAASSIAASATTVGDILVCYACQNTGNAAVDAALTANPGVASDGLLFAFVNTSGTAITGGSFSVSGTSPADTFTVPTIAAGSTFILMPGLTSDGGSHGSGLFAATGSTADTSDGVAGVTDSSIFSFTGLSGVLAVTSNTSGSPAGTFSAGNSSLIKPWISPSGGSTSFLGLGPSGDAGCTNCYFGQVATLDVPSVVSGTPLPAALPLFASGLGALGMLGWRRKRKGAAAIAA
jgi:hypothetical protein